MTAIIEYKKEIEWKDNELEFHGFKFRMVSRPNRYHLDILKDGKWRAVGNYRMREWAMYYAPILHLQKLGVIE